MDDIRRLVLSRRKSIPELAFFSELIWMFRGKIFSRSKKAEWNLKSVSNKENAGPRNFGFSRQRIAPHRSADRSRKDLCIRDSRHSYLHTDREIGLYLHQYQTLQDQIFEKDIPAMRELCRAEGLEDFSVTKIKGRSNYLSLFLF